MGNKKWKGKTECECGNLLPYVTSSDQTVEKRVCEKCGRVHNVEDKPIDWEKISGGKK